MRILPFGKKKTDDSQEAAEQFQSWPEQELDPATHHLPGQFREQGWLSIEQVKKSYKRRLVVRGVSLAVQRGESVGLLGPNGAGKTTVFYMITGLVPADAGNVFIDGMNVTKLPM